MTVGCAMCDEHGSQLGNGRRGLRAQVVPLPRLWQQMDPAGFNASGTR